MCWHLKPKLFSFLQGKYNTNEYTTMRAFDLSSVIRVHINMHKLEKVTIHLKKIKITKVISLGIFHRSQFKLRTSLALTLFFPEWKLHSLGNIKFIPKERFWNFGGFCLGAFFCIIEVVFHWETIHQYWPTSWKQATQFGNIIWQWNPG